MSRRVRRPLIAVCIAVAAVVLVSATWCVALLFVSPDQRQADASPPLQAPLTASLTTGDLVSSTVVPASVVYADAESVPVAGATGESRSVVTKSPLQVGATASTGTQMIEVNGQPVFALQSDFQFYRDMQVGDSGPDVTRLQAALVELGYLDHADGNFGVRTSVAVRELYENAGYEVPVRQSSPARDSSTPQPTASLGPSAMPDNAQGAVAVPYVPATSFIAVRHLPATIRSVPAVGEVISDKTSIALDAAEAQVQVTLSADLSLSPGDAVTVTMDGLDAFAGVVKGVAEAAASGSADNGATPAAVPSASNGTAAIYRADGTPLSPDLVGRAVSVGTRPTVLASGALLAPLSAVAVASGSSSGSMMIRDGEEFRKVDVTIIAIHEGIVALKSEDHAVAAGAAVLLG